MYRRFNCLDLVGDFKLDMHFQGVIDELKGFARNLLILDRHGVSTIGVHLRIVFN
jgi:hypothetical protein